MLSARFMALNLVNVFTAIVEGFLGLRFILKLFAANSSAGFVQWIYDMSSALLAPFRGIFPTQVFEGRYVLEFSTLFAILMYAILALVLSAIIVAVTPDAEADREVVIKKR